MTTILSILIIFGAGCYVSYRRGAQAADAKWCAYFEQFWLGVLGGGK